MMFSTKVLTKSIAAVCIAAVFFSSCVKDPVVQPPSSQKLLLTEFKSGEDITRFEYNADSSVKKIILNNDPVTTDENVTYTVKYLTNKKIDELTGSNGGRIKTTYTNNALTKVEAFIGTIEISESLFAYSANQLRTTEILVFYNSNVGVPFFKSDFTYNAAGNVSKGNIFIQDPLNNQFKAAGHVNNQYDNKINPFAALGDIMLIFWQYASKNNTIKQEYFDETGKAEEVVETTYTYNSYGYPVRATMKETQPGQQPTTEVITFKYQ